MALTTIIMNTTMTAAQLNGEIAFASRSNYLNQLQNYLAGTSTGCYSASFSNYVGATQSTGTITFTGAATAAQTMTIAGVTFTARASGATGNEFNLNATPATQAANLVAAVNASSNLTGIVTASNVLGVVTFTAVVPGTIGNAIGLTTSLSNSTVSGALLTGGTTGTVTTHSYL